TTGIEYFGAKDANNATFSIGQRLMPSYLDALVLHDAYGYVITPPQTFGTFYANLRAADGNVLVREGPTSSDTVTVTTEGGNLVVSVDVGVPVPGTGPAGPLTTVLPLGSVSSITAQARAGDDTFYLAGLPTGVPVSVDGGAGSNRLIGPDAPNVWN